jgi:hypothetical protein
MVLSLFFPGERKGEIVKELKMSTKVKDFYKKAQTDAALKAGLEAVSKKFWGKDGGTPDDREKAIAEIISLAAKHSVTLVREDFEDPKGGLSDDQLKAASGGSPWHQYPDGTWHCSPFWDDGRRF